MTVAITGWGWEAGTRPDTPRPGGRRPRRRLRRALLVLGVGVFTLLAVVGSWIGLSLYRIDHAVHHVGIPASLLAEGRNDLLAIVKGPDHSEQVFVFHAADGHTNVLQIPPALALPLQGGSTVPLDTMSLHAPSAIIGGLVRLGIPVSHYVGVDLHTVSPNSSLGRLATGKLSISSMLTNPMGTTALLGEVASHVYLGPGTPVSAVLSLMNVPAAHPLSVPTARDSQGRLVLAAAFTVVLRAFL